MFNFMQDSDIFACIFCMHMPHRHSVFLRQSFQFSSPISVSKAATVINATQSPHTTPFSAAPSCSNTSFNSSPSLAFNYQVDSAKLKKKLPPSPASSPGECCLVTKGIKKKKNHSLNHIYYNLLRSWPPKCVCVNHNLFNIICPWLPCLHCMWGGGIILMICQLCDDVDTWPQ